MTSLNQILSAERSIFKVFNSFQELSSRATVFASPDLEQIPHWNIIYPHDVAQVLSVEELKTSKIFFAQRNVQGHVASPDFHWVGQCAESSEYFYIDDSVAEGIVAQES